MKIPTDQVPQADNIQAIEISLQAVSEGANTYQDIAYALGYKERQGRYYRLACEILRFTYKTGVNQSAITPFGQQYLEANTEDRKEIFGQAVLSSSLFQRVIPLFESRPEGISKEELERFLSQVTETTPKMVDRRTSSVISWLEHAGIIRSVDGIYVLNSLPESVQVVNYNDPTEPLLPSHFALTEYNIIAQRVKAFQNTITFEIDRVKRDRANDAHNRLTNLLAHKIRKKGGIPKSNILVDLATQVNSGKFIFEVKSTTDRNMRNQIRRGISQLYEYRYLQNISDANLVLVLENPLTDNLGWYQDYLIDDRGIYFMWDGDNNFYCPEAIKNNLSFLFESN
jgi:C-terminal AAA-associated domain